MADDLIEKLWFCANLHPQCGYPENGKLFGAAADRITALQAQNRKLVEALAWYGEQARLARLIHSEGDAGRHALAHDGGKRARAAIAEAEKGEG